jgi:bifunctional ADP-heptose synthase (sugar kinase/adenylyltransferase)
VTAGPRAVTSRSIEKRRIVVIGDTLLDRSKHGVVQRLSPEAPVPIVSRIREEQRPGGAGLAAMLAASDGHCVTLVTALSQDPSGVFLGSQLSSLGVDIIDLGLSGATPTKTRILDGRRLLLTLDEGDPSPVLRAKPIPATATAAISAADAVLVRPSSGTLIHVARFPFPELLQ